MARACAIEIFGDGGLATLAALAPVPIPKAAIAAMNVIDLNT
jgi:hypothetical protein